MKRSFWTPLGFFLLVCTSMAQTPVGSQPLVIEDFIPTGWSPRAQQVRARFSASMVALGDPRAPQIPFEQKCTGEAIPSGSGRWVDDKNWVYEFVSPLPAQVSCLFQAKSDLKSLEGGSLTGKKEFSFFTGGTVVLATFPYPDSQIDEDQSFLLSFDGRVDAARVEQQAYFTVEGMQEKIPVSIVSDPKKIDPVLNQVSSWNSAFQNLGPSKSVMLLEARRRFPAKAHVTLVWSKQKGSPEQVFHFTVRPEFSAHFRCEKENADADCHPFGKVVVQFTGEVPVRFAKKIQLKSKEGKSWSPVGLSSLGDSATVGQVEFSAVNEPFPEKAVLSLELPRGLEDDLQRQLSNADQFPLSVVFAENPPLAKFSAEFGILERSDPVLPLTVRNLEARVPARLGHKTVVPGDLSEESQNLKWKGKILRLTGDSIRSVIEWMVNLQGDDSTKRGEKSVFDPGSDPFETEGLKLTEITLPKPHGEKPMEVIGIPLSGAGFYIAEIESRRLGKSLLGSDHPFFVHSSVLVTHLSVHFKKGRESSEVWVTTLDEAKPVENAQIGIYDCQGISIRQGVTNSSGLVRFSGELPEEKDCGREFGKGRSYSPYASGYYVTAEKGDDFSFVHSSWNHGIENWRMGLAMDYGDSSVIAHTVFDRTLVRAGETLHMKHILRKKTMTRFELEPRGQLPHSMRIRHRGSGQEYELPLLWAEGGSEGGGYVETHWVIPSGAKVGTYEVLLGQLESGQFQVEEFRLPLMKGTIQLPTQKIIAPESIEVDLSVEYLSGGMAGNLPVQLRYQLSGQSFPKTEEFTDYFFSNGPPKDSTQSLETKVQKTTARLDSKGFARVKLSNLPHIEVVQDLLIEMEYSDPSGEIQTVAKTVRLFPSAYLMGLKKDGYPNVPGPIQIASAVVDPQGKAVPGAEVKIDLFEEKTFSHRKKLIGGFYSYESITELHRVGDLCRGVTDSKGSFECLSQLTRGGSFVIQATTTDSQGHSDIATERFWVYDQKPRWFSGGDHDRIDLIPEKRRYEAGEKAVFQVQMPFQEAMAWVTVEREGVLDSFVVPLSSHHPVIEVPIQENYAPNVFISALVVRGRKSQVQPTGLVDLGKPAFKLGTTQIAVDWKAHELHVQVKPEKEVYHVRDKARISVHVAPPQGVKLPPGSSIAFAAVDESLLQLAPNSSWNLLEAMMGTRNDEVQTYTAQMQIVGKRHFGLKAIPQGGGGGKILTRELFNTLLFWKANVVLDQNGDAELEVPLNDSITSFRLVAIATGGVNLFGTGEATIRSSQDLVLLSGLSPMAREGDRFPAVFTLKNASDQSMQLEVQGTFGSSLETKALDAVALTLQPGDSQTVQWKIQVPPGVQDLRYEVQAVQKGEAGARDRLQVSQRVLPVVPVRPIQSTLVQVSEKEVLPVEKPAQALPSRGGVRVILKPTLLAGLTGVREYMDQYPFTCFEQKVSRAIALQDKTLWKKVMEELPSYLDEDGLVKFFPTSFLEGSDVLTSYVLAIAQEAGWEIPTALQQRMVTGLKKFLQGNISRKAQIATIDLPLRKLSVLDALSRLNEADASWTQSLEIQPQLWPTSAVIDWVHVLERLKAIPQREKLLGEARGVLQTRMVYQGTSFGFSTQERDELGWLLASTDSNANRFLLTALDFQGWQAIQADIPRMARGVVERQIHGHWSTTPSNAWGVLALKKFIQNYEKAPVRGKSEVSCKKKTQLVDWKQDPAGGSVEFAWPTRRERETLEIVHFGSGKPWAMVQSLAAIPLTRPFESGYRIQKSWNPIEQKKKGVWSQGDIVRVHLDLEAQSDRTWVVVNDPIPEGATILGTGLGNSSRLLTEGEKQEGNVWPAFIERKIDAFQAYYQWVPQGKWTVEYTLRFNGSGQMNLPITRVEAMYSPEVFGEIPNAPIHVVE